MWTTQHLCKRIVRLDHDVSATILGCGRRSAWIFDRDHAHGHRPWRCQIWYITNDGCVFSPTQAPQLLTSGLVADQYTNWEEKIVVKPNGKRVVVERNLSMDKIYHAYYWWVVQSSPRRISRLADPVS